MLVVLLLAITELHGITEPVVAHANPGTTVNDSYDPVFVVLDTSSSMSETDSKNKVKLEGARSAVLDLIGALAPETPFGMIAYPGRTSKLRDGCPQGDLELPIGPLNQADASAAVRRLTADGETPTGPALKYAAELITASKTQKGTIVLVSDGESNCGQTDVCEVAKQLSRDGVAVNVNTVGFQISQDGAKELSCIANATGGQYVDAGDEKQLQNALQDLSGARLTLSATVPNPLPAVSGTGTAGPVARLTIRNDGHKTADDVRLSLDFKDGDGHPGAILVPRPVRFLGGLAPGESRSVDMIVRPDASRLGSFAWLAAATATNAAPKKVEGKAEVVEPFGTSSQLTKAGLLQDVNNVVILGDSYSSGQGAPAGYLPGTTRQGPKDNDCRRSNQSYGRVLFPEAVIIACGGAVTANFYDQQHSGNAAMPPQLEQLRKLALSENSPDAVLLSVGGNDSQFAGIVTLCTLAPPGQVCGAEGKNPPPSEVVAKIANSLRRVYRDVNRAINDDEARRHRSGHYAPIVVVPYPRILPAQQSGLQGGNCQALISAEEVTYLNAFLDALNLEIAAAVGSLTSDHVPVFYASDVVPAFQPNHTICATKDSYATFESNPLVMADNGLKQTLPPELLHPNALGYKAMARAIAAWSANRLMMTDPKAPDYIAVDTKKLSWFDNTVANATLNQLDIYMAGGDATINEKGFAPSSTIIFRLDSIPRIVGSASATDDGSITATVTIPTDTAPGLHHLHAIGLDSIGAQHDVVETIWVAPPYTPYAVIVVLAGLTGLAVGFAGIRRNRKATLATA